MLDLQVLKQINFTQIRFPKLGFSRNTELYQTSPELVRKVQPSVRNTKSQVTPVQLVNWTGIPHILANPNVNIRFHLSFSLANLVIPILYIIASKQWRPCFHLRNSKRCSSQFKPYASSRTIQNPTHLSLNLSLYIYIFALVRTVLIRTSL